MSDRRIKPYNGWFVDEKDRSPKVMALIEAEFDAEADEEDLLNKKKLEKEKHARKMAVLRTLSFPVEFIGGFLMFGKKFAKERWVIQTGLVKFIFKKITYRQLVKFLERHG